MKFHFSRSCPPKRTGEVYDDSGDALPCLVGPKSAATRLGVTMTAGISLIASAACSTAWGKFASACTPAGRRWGYRVKPAAGSWALSGALMSKLRGILVQFLCRFFSGQGFCVPLKEIRYALYFKFNSKYCSVTFVPH